MKVFSKETAEGLKIHKDAIKVIYNIEQMFDTEVEQPSLTTGRIKEDAEEKQTAEMKVIEILQKELEEQRKSNEIKDKQIQALTDSLQQSQQMLSNEQKLNAMNTQRILLLEENTRQNKRKGIFDVFNIFKRKQVEE